MCAKAGRGKSIMVQFIALPVLISKEAQGLRFHFHLWTQNEWS
jgi:hypothetical protein